MFSQGYESPNVNVHIIKKWLSDSVIVNLTIVYAATLRTLKQTQMFIIWEHGSMIINGPKSEFTSGNCDPESMDSKRTQS